MGCFSCLRLQSLIAGLGQCRLLVEQTQNKHIPKVMLFFFQRTLRGIVSLRRNSGRKTRSIPFKCTSLKARDNARMVEERGKLTNKVSEDEADGSKQISTHQVGLHAACPRWHLRALWNNSSRLRDQSLKVMSWPPESYNSGRVLLWSVFSPGPGEYLCIYCSLWEHCQALKHWEVAHWNSEI